MGDVHDCPFDSALEDQGLVGANKARGKPCAPQIEGQ